MSEWGTLGTNTNALQKLKGRLRHALGAIHWKQLRERPIVVFATRRGGSTLLAEIVASQPGVDYYDEPLNMWHYRPHFNRLPHAARSRFVSLAPRDRQLLHDYFRALLDGEIRYQNTWNPLRPTWSFRVQRLVVKLLGANTLMGWLDTVFNLDVVYLLRHPAAVAHSCIRLGWGNDASVYLADEEFCRLELGEKKTRRVRAILEKGSQLQAFVTEWCLENHRSLQMWRERPWLTLTYEEMVSRPRQVVELLGRRLKLPEPRRMARTAMRPSRTVFDGESRRSIRRRGPSSPIGNWTRECSPSSRLEIQNVLDDLGVSVYRADSPFPAAEVCQFGNLSAEIARA